MTDPCEVFTPEWGAARLIEIEFPDLSENDRVAEPSCGRGSFLLAIPDHVEAIGVEIKPHLAEESQQRSGRQVICGDFREVELPWRPTAIIGNPPFRRTLIDGFLKRASEILTPDGRCGLILPAYTVLNSSRVLEWGGTWHVTYSPLPRDFFGKMRHMTAFCTFRRRGGASVAFSGILLMEELASINQMRMQVRKILYNGGQRGAWREATAMALRALGGAASLPAIYDWVAPRRPTNNQFWREKIRQTLQRGPEFRSLSGGWWELQPF